MIFIQRIYFLYFVFKFYHTMQCLNHNSYRYLPPPPPQGQYYNPDLYPPPSNQQSSQVVQSPSGSGSSSYQPQPTGPPPPTIVDTYPPPPVPPAIVDPYPPPPPHYYTGYAAGPAGPCYTHQQPTRNLAFIGRWLIIGMYLFIPLTSLLLILL